jgi:hypothetical protein
MSQTASESTDALSPVGSYQRRPDVSPSTAPNTLPLDDYTLRRAGSTVGRTGSRAPKHPIFPDYQKRSDFFGKIPHAATRHRRTQRRCGMVDGRRVDSTMTRTRRLRCCFVGRDRPAMG